MINDLKIINVLEFFSNRWVYKRDTAEGVLQDFLDLKIFPNNEQRDKSIKFLHDFFIFLESDRNRRIDRIQQQILLPGLMSISSVIDYRTVIESDFDWILDDASEYKPEINRTVPVIILKLNLDDLDPVIFQCDNNDLENMINKLIAVKRELDASEKILK